MNKPAISVTNAPPRNTRVLIIGIGGQLNALLDMLNYPNISLAGIITLPTVQSDQALARLSGHIVTYRYDDMPEALQKLYYDYIIVATPNNPVIIETLRQLSVPKQQIIDLSFLYNQNLASLVNLLAYHKAHSQQCDTFMTGLSYAYHGADMNVYGSRMLNIASTSQDLFYDYELAKTAIAQAPTAFKQALIGLAPYSLHSDLSLSSLNWCTFTYYPLCKTMHNYFLTTPQMQRIFNDKYTEQCSKATVELQFPWHDRLGYFTDNTLDTNTMLKGRTRAEEWRGKYFPATVKENRQILQNYLRLCQAHHIKPYLVVYPVTDFYYKYFDSKKVDEFYYEIRLLNQQFNFDFIDLWRDERFTYADFFDVDHLNEQGANKVSRLLCARIYS